MTIFVKYDIWPNILNELKTRNLHAILISALYIKNQSYFKFYGSILRKGLFAFKHIFTQNETSKELLESIGYHHATTAGDTKFDRVTDQLKQNNTLDFIESFKQDKLCVVAGSTWPEDESLLINYINSEITEHIKFIVAPHNIKTNQIQRLQENLNAKTVLYSEKEDQDVANAQVFIIDTIGLLSKIYSYADIAYIGGAMGSTGLHNTLEAAVFGVPIIIGNKHSEFPEAQAMIDISGMYEISNQQEFNNILNLLITDKQKRKASGKHNLDYINQNKGAVNHILKYLNVAD